MCCTAWQSRGRPGQHPGRRSGQGANNVDGQARLARWCQQRHRKNSRCQSNSPINSSSCVILMFNIMQSTLDSRLHSFQNYLDCGETYRFMKSWQNVEIMQQPGHESLTMNVSGRPGRCHEIVWPLKYDLLSSDIFDPVTKYFYPEIKWPPRKSPRLLRY